MKRLRILVGLVFLIMGYGGQAFGLLEVRGTYGMNLINPEALSTQMPAFSDLTGFGVDAIVSLPVFPIGIGVRGERLTSTKSATVQGYYASLNTTLSRLALLVNFRIINTGIYLGALGTLGFLHNATYSHNSDLFGGASGDLASNSASTTSVGIEGGLHLMDLILGGEIGYMMGSSRTFEKDGVLLTFGGKAVELTYNGPYLKAHVGYDF